MKNTEKITPNLVESAIKGNIKALEKLLKLTEKEVTSFLFYTTNSKNDSDDMVQETLLKIAKNIKNLKDVKSYKSWVNKIAIRQYYDYMRKKDKGNFIIKSETNECDEAENIADNKKSPDEKCIGYELSRVIRESVCKLNEPYKMAIIMREFEGMSYDEIAKITNTGVGTVKSRIARARNRLKKYIKPYMEQQ